MTVDGPPASGSVPQIQSPSLVGQILDGRYRLIGKLGEGGMGEVYAAEHIHIEKRFAIKLLRPEIVSNAEAVTRFRQEARSSSSIGHRNIIAIEDFGQLADGRIYMCMELLNGAALNEIITQPVGVDRLLNIMIQTGHGLAAAHAKGIIHRDMKPENVFVTVGPGGEDIPKLLDFGIAKVSGNDGQNHLTRTGTIFGTPFYMAPEQALGNPVDARTDIYAVGVIMYECFSGSLPFQGDSFMGILTQHITMEPEPVAQRAARAGRQLPPGLADVITRCMQKNPAQRFATMDELVNVLVQIYRGVVGPGMSTYMEAFPVMPSSAHQVQPTPPPMTRPVGIGNASAPTIAAPSGSAPILAQPVGPSGGYMGVSTAIPRRGKAGLIIAVLAVLAVGGGVAAFVVVNNKGPAKGPGDGSEKGSGSQVVIIERGSGSSRAGHDGSDGSGSATISHDGSGSSAGSDLGSNHAGSDQGSGHGGSNAGSDNGSDAGSNTPPTVEVVPVLLFARNGVVFDVYEDGKKVLDGPDTLEVPRGEKRTVVIKARGFKDKTIVVDGKKKKLQFSLERLATQGPGSGHVPPPPPPGPNCSNAIVDPTSKACVAQYCAKHPDDQAKCGLE
ncbi:MAG TPA: protein kinase [Kofleriaceae bacterium]|nr:protein kinase [Kofleriaceae bacterium]